MMSADKIEQRPSFPGKHFLVAGIAIDTLGSGMYVPFTLVFFWHVTDLPLSLIGLVLTIGGLVGMAALPVAGAAVDRFGARRMLVWGYAARGVAFALFPLAHGLPLFAALVLVTSVGTRVHPAMIQARLAEVVDGADRDKLQALTRSLANAGFGAGALIASLLIAGRGDSGYLVVAWLNAASFLVAAVLAARTPAGAHAVRGRTAQGGGYRLLWKDRPYLGLTFANLLVALGYTSLSVLLPVYAIEWLHLPEGLVGASFLLNTALCATLGVPIAALARRHFGTRTRAAAAGAALFTASFVGQIVLGTVLPRNVAMLTAALLVIVVIATVAELVHSPASGALSQSAAPKPVRGRYLAAYQVSWSLAYALAPSLFTLLVGIDGRLPWLVVAVAALAGGVLLLVLERSLPPEAVFSAPPAADPPGPAVVPDQQAARRLAMNGRTLTQEYLAKVTGSGLKAGELIGRLPESEQLNAFYEGSYLSRPLFLGRAERDRAHSDLEHLLAALGSLPDRLFDGDFAAFSRAVGMTEGQVCAVMRSRHPTMTRLARADLYFDGVDFKLLELNLGSPIGGIDNADMCRGLLEHRVLREFADSRGLGYVDTLREHVNTILVETGFEPGDHPTVAVTDWPSSFEGERPFMTLLCERWREFGLEAHPCHVGQLAARDGRVWLGDRPVDIVFRTFGISHLLESPEAPALVDPLLDAASRGEVVIFTPLDTSAYESKGALAMLSDEDNRGLFTPEELASLDRILPWTRMARPGMVTLETGERVDLVDYAIAHQHELVLKPTLLFGGQGVVLGWAADLTPARWREHLAAALDGPYILQRRIRPTAEFFPDENGELQPWNVLWGMFTVAKGYGGANARAVPASAGHVVMNGANGAYSGPALHELEV
jgi:MFS family permease